MTNRRQLKESALPVDFQAGYLDHFQSPAVHESLKVTWRNQALKSGETTSSSHTPSSRHNSVPSFCSSLCFEWTFSDRLCQPQWVWNCSVSFKTVMVLSSGSGSWAFSMAFWSRISTRWSSVSWSWQCCSSKTSSVSYIRICALGNDSVERRKYCI